MSNFVFKNIIVYGCVFNHFFINQIFAFLLEKGVSSDFAVFFMPHPFIDIDL
jgi:hypothetical protein